MKVLGYNIPMTGLTMYLAYVPGNILPKEDRYLMKILLAACKKIIIRRWRQSDPPTTKEWLQMVNSIFQMEILTYRLRTKQEQCLEKWEKLTVFKSTNRYFKDNSVFFPSPFLFKRKIRMPQLLLFLLFSPVLLL